MMFETAVIEVAGNVVEHRRPPGRVTWAFRLSVLGDRLEARLSDSGEEYPGGTWGISMPADLLQENGRGLPLATAVLDSLEYERSGHVNHWTMLRRRASAGLARPPLTRVRPDPSRGRMSAGKIS